MNRRTVAAFSGIILAVSWVLVSGFLTGCDEADRIRALKIIPDFVDLTAGASNDTQTFSVDADTLNELSLPLEWRVANPSLGRIVFSGGTDASYVRNTTLSGDNSIIVEDQLGAEGIATVRQ